MDFYTLIATLSLIIQLIVLALLLYGYTLYRRSAFRMHGKIMATALVLHLATVIAVMLPSFALAIAPDFIAVNPTDTISILSIVHGVLGVVALGFGIWFVASWRFRADVKGCFGKRKQMLATLTIWVLSLLIGVALYGIFYWEMLMA